MLPLFPLGTVLYPGLVLPLHIFEERYRQLVRDLLASAEPRRFGVIAIREGRETGVPECPSPCTVGCTAMLRQVQKYEDGRYDLVTVGAHRFRLLELDDSGPYLQGEVELLPDEAGDPAQAALAAQAVRPASAATCGRWPRWPSTTPSSPAAHRDPAQRLAAGNGDDDGPDGPRSRTCPTRRSRCPMSSPR